MNRHGHRWLNDCVNLCQEIIQIPSLSGQEKELANFLQNKMLELDYDEVWIDEPGNVVGKISGDSSLPTIGFTAHMDHVSPGNEEDWDYPPYSGTKAKGYIHGRGASDTKGAIATQVYIPQLIRDSGVEHGDIYVFFVVLEEKGGYGSREFDRTPLDLVILGEPTSNNLRIGHRGRVELLVSIEGKSAHASVPSKADNPHYSMARFLGRLENLSMNKYNDRESSAAPTLYRTDQESSNVIPSKAVLTMDWRNVPGETTGEIKKIIGGMLPEKGKVEVNQEELQSYKGTNFIQKRERKPYVLPESDVFVSAIENGLTNHLEREVDVNWWDFATDAGCFASHEIPVVGFSPCEEKFAHTSEDRVSIDLMEVSLECYPVIIDAVSESTD